MPLNSKALNVKLGRFDGDRSNLIDAVKLGRCFTETGLSLYGDYAGVREVLVYEREGNPIPPSQARWRSGTWWFQVIVLSPEQSETYSKWDYFCCRVAALAGLDVLEVAHMRSNCNVWSRIVDYTECLPGCAYKDVVRFYERYHLAYQDRPNFRWWFGVLCPYSEP